ncbi:hypothetical protein ACMGG8_23635 [Pseudomonas sp. BNK-45]|uniref:hypothetical protein n=1 Tax=Pseudomonas sp. BNK-45 TaxID=3376180 RepID=UPI0039BED3E6
MRITLTALHSDPSSALWVDFSCAFGEGRGQWLGAPPQVAQEHEVELSLEDEFRWQHNLWVGTGPEPRMARDKDGLHITGQLLQVDEDGGAALAMGASIVLLSVQGRTPPRPGFVSLLARQVSLQPLAL